MRTLRVILALVLALAAVPPVAAAADAATTPAPTPTPTVPSTARAEGEPLTVVVAPENNGRLRAGTDLVVRVTVANASTGAVGASTVTLFLDRTPFADAAAYAAWIRPAPGAGLHRGTALGATVQLPPLAPGQSAAPAVLLVPQDAVGLTPAASPWGARALSVVVRGSGSGAGTELGVGRSAIVWDAGAPVAAVPFTTAVPITVPASDSGLLDGDRLAAYTGPDGVLTRELDSVSGQPVAIGVDPMIVASIQVLGTAAPASASAWLQRLQASSAVTFPLAYADADVSATVQAAGAALAPESFGFALDPARFPAGSAPTPTATPTAPASPAPTQGQVVLPTTAQLTTLPYTTDRIAWPADGTLTQGSLAPLAAAGRTQVLVSDEQLDVKPAGLTPPAVVQLGSSTGVVSNAVLSASLRDAASAQSTDGFSAAVATLSAGLAVVDAERPGDPRAVLATLARASAAPFRLGDTLIALSTLPWVSETPLTQLLAATPATGVTLVDRAEPAARTGAATRMVDWERRIATFSVVADDPAAVTAPVRLRLLALLSNAWAADPGWSAAVDDYVTKARATVTAVHVVATSSITVLSDRETLPVSIANALTVPVTVVLTVSSASPQLVLDQTSFPVQIAPDSTFRQQLVPVRSIGSGTVDLTFELAATNGMVVGPSVRIAVNSQPQWETIGTIAFAVLVAALVVAGVVRTLRRRRRISTPAGAAADAGGGG